MARGAGGELVTSRGAGCRPGTAEDGLDRPIHVGLVGRPVRHRDAHRELDTAAEYAEQALRIAAEERWTAMLPWMEAIQAELDLADGKIDQADRRLDRKSTRLNSSHMSISYAVFCLKKKKISSRLSCRTALLSSI